MPGCPKCGMQYLASHVCPPVTMATNTAPLYVQVPDRYAEGYRAGRIAALRQVGCFHADEGFLACPETEGDDPRAWCRGCRLLAESEQGEVGGDR